MNLQISLKRDSLPYASPAPMDREAHALHLLWPIIGLVTFVTSLLLLFGAYRESRAVLHTFDTGLYLQLLENLHRYGDFASSVTGEHNFLAHHFQPIVVAALPAYILFPSATTLFTLDALSILACIFILLRGWKNNLPPLILGAAALSMLLHPTIASRIFFSFVPETFALPALAIQARLLLRERPLGRRELILLALAQGFAGCCKETLWIVNATSSVLLAWRFRHSRLSLLGNGALALINSALFIFLFIYWMPAHTVMPHYYGLKYYRNPDVTGDGVLDIVQAMFANLTSLRSLKTLGLIIALSGFIPFLDLNSALLAAIPALALILTTSHPPVHNPSNQYLIPALPFLWASGLNALQSKRIERILPNLARLVPLLIVAMPVTFTWPEVTFLLHKITDDPRTEFIAADMDKVRQAIPDKKQAIIVADGNLQPRLADYRNVSALLEFIGNPHAMDDSRFAQVTDVVTLFDPRALTSCEAVTPDVTDQLDYDYRAFYKYCHWIKDHSFAATAYPASGIFHFHVGSNHH